MFKGNSKAKMKLCYVIPDLDAKIDSHYFHIYEFLEVLGKDITLSVITKRSARNIKIKNVQSVNGAFNMPLIGALHLFLLIFIKRLQGYRKFYVHYSTTAAIFCSVVTKLSGGQTYYWNCGLIWEIKEIGLRYIKNRIPFLITLKLIDYLVTGTKTMADGYSKNYNFPREMVLVIPNYINLERFNISESKTILREQLGTPLGKKIILYVHRLAPRKGVHYLVPIAKQIIKKKKEVHFLIVGSGPYRKRLLEEIKSNNLSPYFTLVGSIPNSKVPLFMHSADVFIMPSEEEGFPRVLLEAMASNIPFVATDVGGVKDILTKLQIEKCLVKVGDISSFSNKLINLLSKNNTTLIKDGSEQVKNFRINNVEDIFINTIFLGDMRKL